MSHYLAQFGKLAGLRARLRGYGGTVNRHGHLILAPANDNAKRVFRFGWRAGIPSIQINDGPWEQWEQSQGMVPTTPVIDYFLATESPSK